MTNGIYYDGLSARGQDVGVTTDGVSLIFSGPATLQRKWNLKGLHAIDAALPNHPFRITHEGEPGARLTLMDADFVKSLLALAPNLKLGMRAQDVARVLAWTVGSLAVMAALAYATLTLLPDRVAHMMPGSWRDRVGRQIETAVIDGNKACSTPEASAAMGALIANIAEGDPDLPPITVTVYDLPVLNAFAVSGGRIIISNKVLTEAEAPEEFAGVLAHEIGHVHYLHPEAQMVRLTGMQVLVSLVTGSANGNITANTAMLAAILQYSRSAEDQADAYADETLTKARIDPEGLKRFFEKILKLETARTPQSDTLSALGNIFATHPGTAERMQRIKPLPPGVSAREALTPDQWQALKHICG